jgi:flagellar protein FlaG
MNILDISNDVKQSIRSENAATAEAMARSVRSNVEPTGPNAVQKQDSDQQDKHSQKFTREELDTLIQEAEEHLANNDVKLKFNVSEEDDAIQVEIVDGSGKTIRKIPEDDLLKLSKSLKDLERGFLDKVS